jgi:hypothetical protein
MGKADLMSHLSFDAQQAVDPHQVLEFASALVQLPSENPPGTEEPIAAFLATCLYVGLPPSITKLVAIERVLPTVPGLGGISMGRYAEL